MGFKFLKLNMEAWLVPEILPGRLGLLGQHGGNARSFPRPDADHHSTARSGEVGSKNKRRSLGGDREGIDKLGVGVF